MCHFYLIFHLCNITCANFTGHYLFQIIFEKNFWYLSLLLMELSRYFPGLPPQKELDS